MNPDERSRWIADGDVLAQQLSESIDANKISGDEILFVIVSRGGLLLLPAMLKRFPVSLISVIACSCRMSSTLRSESAKHTYIITASWTITGDVLK